MNNIIVIVKKELKRIFGDRKMLISLYIMPMVLMIAICSIMGNMIGSMEADIVEHIPTVTVVNATDSFKNVIDLTYAGNADVNYISEEEYASKKEELEDKVLEGDADLIVYLPGDFEDKVEDYNTPEMTIYFNDTEDYSTQAYSVFSTSAVNTYQNLLLEKRFGDLGNLVAFKQNTEHIYKESKANTQFISMMLPYLMVMMLFAGVMAVGVDAIAGEKERGTLSSMLLSPAKRVEIVIGKLISMAILSGLSAVVYCVSMIIAMNNMGAGAEQGGAEMGFGSISFNAIQIIELLVTMLILVYLYVGVVGLLATIAKDTKAASSLVSPMYIVVVILGVMTIFTTGKSIPAYRYLIPVYGNALAIKDICSNELLTANFLCSVAGTFGLGIILTIAIAKAFNSEKIMFNA